MAGMSSPQSNKNMQDIEGYVHDVSPVKTPRSGNRYFDFTIQEATENTRVVCFMPENRETLKQNEMAKSPVRILSVSPQKRKFQPEEIEYKIGSKAKVVQTLNLPFPWAESTAKQAKQVSITDVNLSSSIGDLVSLTAKVLWKGETETKYSHTMRKNLAMSNLVIADATGAIEATVWEAMIDQFSVGSSYELNKFRVNFFNKKHLNGTPDSEVNEAKVIEVPPNIVAKAEKLKPKEKQTKNVSGRIIGVDVAMALICLNSKCKARIQNPDDGKDFINCASCKTSMLKDFLKPAVSANIILVDENGENLEHHYCSGAVLNGMFESIKETEHYNIKETDVSKLPRKLITETLLLVKKACFELQVEQNLVLSMKVQPN